MSQGAQEGPRGKVATPCFSFSAPMALSDLICHLMVAYNAADFHVRQLHLRAAGNGAT